MSNMNSKQKKEVDRLCAEVKSAHSEADNREKQLRSAGLDESAIKVDPTFIDLSDRFWDLCLALECANGEEPTGEKRQRVPIAVKHAETRMGRCWFGEDGA